MKYYCLIVSGALNCEQLQEPLIRQKRNLPVKFPATPKLSMFKIERLIDAKLIIMIT